MVGHLSAANPPAPPPSRAQEPSGSVAGTRGHPETAETRSGPFPCRTCAPSLPIQPGEVIKTAAEWDAEGNGPGVFGTSWRDRIVDWLVCPECFRLRFSPMHLLTRGWHS